ncbi:MAG TPA: hypothetical protein VE046_19165 [Steroidobacteraceae bacterium]|nr:hypothetical protein [Steroidobacteraceae bacterium]
MDAKFIEENQIIEKYLSGKLPLKGQLDFERYCVENPELLDELKLADRLHRGMRLLEAGSGSALLEPKEKPWQKLPVLIGAAAVIVVLLVAVIAFGAKYSGERAHVAALERRLVTGPLRPPSEIRSLHVKPDRAATSRINFSVSGGGHPELLELRIDLSTALQSAFRITIDKKDQARVGTLERVLRDSNGLIKLTFNTSGVSPGIYRFRIEGITMRGDLIPVGWMNAEVSE